ncbi:hypothetical protein [Providencia phage PSTRCR_127]|nr:hypothetical protein [Providencia phage PSTRCR_127]
MNENTIEEKLGIASWEGWDQMDVLSITFYDAVLKENNVFGLPTDVKYSWITVDFQHLMIDVGIDNDTDEGKVVFNGKIDLSVVSV